MTECQCRVTCWANLLRAGRRKGVWADRLERMAGAIAAGNAFIGRVAESAGDTIRLADLMAEAIEIARVARGLEAIGQDGRAAMCMEETQAGYCMDAARAAYLDARRSNQA